MFSSLKDIKPNYGFLSQNTYCFQQRQNLPCLCATGRKKSSVLLPARFGMIMAIEMLLRK